MNESAAAVAFYLGLVAFIYGLIRITTASVERRRRDALGIVALVAGAALFVVAIGVYLRSGKQVLPF